MKLKTTLTFLWVITAGLQLVFSQSDKAPVADLSPLTLSYFQQLKDHPSGLIPGYIYKTRDNKNYYISAFIKTEPGFDTKILHELDIITGTQAGDIYSVHIPLEKLREFVYKPGISYIELDEPVYPMMDSAKRHSRVDSVHNGLGLSMAYDGKNVLVGIVDQGFDYDHPQFKDTAGKHYRILRVWEENTIGNSYAGGTYGTEYRNISDILAHGSDSKIHTHGTHVAGITTGSGIGGDTTGRLWRGMAHGSDILIVGIGPSENAWISTGLTNMIDGINYCFKIAESMGLPVVVNLSWGSPTGPHDGTSLFSQACDAITGKRKVFVCSAGNNGDNAIHLAKTFTLTDTVVNTFVTFSSFLPFKKNRVDAWGETGQSLSASIALYDGTKTVASTKVYNTSDGRLHVDTLIGKNNDTCFVKITTKVERFNNKPRVLVELYNKTNENIWFSVKGTPGTINMWQGYVYNSSGYYGTFNNGGKPWGQNGDNKSTISDQSTTRSALCIGSYNSKVRYKSYKGVVTDYSQYFTVGQRSDFSSRGPTADKRIKPDIMGPGSFLASGISSFDPSYKVGGSNFNSVVKMYVDPQTKDTNYYGMAQGTSMSSPAVAGIVALMLQINPDLTPEMVRNIFDRTAIEDKFTQNLPDEGNNNWGQGKINAMAALKLTKLMYDPANAGTIKVFPNPATDNRINVFYQGTKNEAVSFQLSDLAGRVIYVGESRLHFGENWFTIDLNNITTGNNLYFLKWKTEYTSGVERVVIE